MDSTVELPILAVPIKSIVRLNHRIYPLPYKARLDQIVKVWDKAIDNSNKVYGILRIFVGRKKSYEIGILIPTHFAYDDLMFFLDIAQHADRWRMGLKFVKGYNGKWIELIGVSSKQKWWNTLHSKLP